MIAHTSIGGRRVRIELSNAFGSEPLAIGAAQCGRDHESAIVPVSDRTLLFRRPAGVLDTAGRPPRSAMRWIWMFRLPAI